MDTRNPNFKDAWCFIHWTGWNISAGTNDDLHTARDGNHYYWGARLAVAQVQMSCKSIKKSMDFSMMFSFSPADVSYLKLVYPAPVPHCSSTGSGPCGQEFLWWHDETFGGRSGMLAASMKVHADVLWIGQDKRFLIRWFVMICCCSDSNIFIKIWTFTCWRPRASLQHACLDFFCGGDENHAYFLRLHHIPGWLLDDSPAARKLSSTVDSPVLQTDTLML